MDIRDVSAEISRASQNEKSGPSRRGSASAEAQKATEDRDFFENSGRLGKVRSLIDSLVQAPETSNEAITRAKELLASGELDSAHPACSCAAIACASGSHNGRPN